MAGRIWEASLLRNANNLAVVRGEIVLVYRRNGVIEIRTICLGSFGRRGAFGRQYQLCQSFPNSPETLFSGQQMSRSNSGGTRRVTYPGRKGGVSALSAIKLDIREAIPIRKVRIALIAKQKMPSKSKARLRIRGDTISMANESHSSIPAPRRASLRIPIALMTAARMQGVTVDIPQAFLQAGTVPMAERLIVRAPNCIEFPWKRQVRSDNDAPETGIKYCLITNKPFYGIRPAPYRWFIHLRTTLLAGGLRQERSEICVFYQFEGEMPLIYLVVHVGDLFIAYR